MKIIPLLLLFTMTLHAQNDFSRFPVYDDKDLGLSYASAKSVFKVWAPSAEALTLRLYEKGTGGEPLHTETMRRAASGLWVAELPGDWKGRFYTFQALHNGEWRQEVPDPYAKLVGVNGKRAMVGDLKDTNPANWSQDESPLLKQAGDAIIYELHVRDASIDPHSGIQHKGKFLGLTETGTKNSAGLSTGLDHIRELGVTHVHLLPLFDYYTVDETKPEEPKYNWGYDPLNYNTTEGSYATNPYDGITRVREFKELVQTFHKNGLRVVMDMVYNHTMFSETSNFNQLVPGYYYRQAANGNFSNGSGCGNETASDRPMMQKFILESLLYWMQEYHVDGFRFDLMALHDIETMNLIAETLHKIRPDIILYGEGWTGGDTPLSEDKRALKKNTSRIQGVAAFSDDIRDALKGSVFDAHDRGFVSGKTGQEESIKFGIVGAIQHPQLDYNKVNYSKAPWAKEPTQCIVYSECHDNHTLWDRLSNSAADAPEDARIRMYLLAQTIVLTSQGIPFLHAGTEMLRSKQGVENSFNSPDSINAIYWDRKTKYKQVNQFFQQLIQLRKKHPAFRMGSASLVAAHLHFFDPGLANVVGYTLDGDAALDSWKQILVLFNGNNQEVNIAIPEGAWKVVLQGQEINEKGIRKEKGGKVMVPAISALILTKE